MRSDLIGRLVRSALLRLLAAALGASILIGLQMPASAEPSQNAPHKLRCGEERWPVKTLSDRRARLVDFTPKHSSVEALRRKSRPAIGTDTPRLPGPERTTYRVHARLIAFATEEDRDVHLVIAQPHHRSATMIVEFPDVRCNGARHSIKKRALRRARHSLVAACGEPSSDFRSLHGRATVTGVGFFDLLHGQNGVAPNGIELHPILRFKAARCVGPGGTAR